MQCNMMILIYKIGCILENRVGLGLAVDPRIKKHGRDSHRSVGGRLHRRGKSLGAMSQRLEELRIEGRFQTVGEVVEVAKVAEVVLVVEVVAVEQVVEAGAVVEVADVVEGAAVVVSARSRRRREWSS